jgi:hypothetical protein
MVQSPVFQAAFKVGVGIECAPLERAGMAVHLSAEQNGHDAHVVRIEGVN